MARTIIPPDPTNILPGISTAVQQAGGLLTPAAMLIASQGYANRNKREMLRADVNQYKSGQLGLSRAQQAQMLGNTTNAVSGQQAANQAQLNQLAAAGTLSGGQLAQIAGAQQGQQLAALGQAQQSIDAASQQQTDARRREIQGNVQNTAAQNIGYAVQAAQAVQNKPPTFTRPPDDIQSVQAGVEQRALGGVTPPPVTG